MKTLVISRPIYDNILPLVEFPQDGDKFFIENSVKSFGNVGCLVAITLASYGMDVSFTGMIGEDETGRKIKEILESYRIDTQYIETSYTEKTLNNYKIYNSKTNKFTTITEKSIKNNLTKYKYEFIPDAIVMDDGDYNANLAAINNYPNSNLIYIGEKFTKDSLIYCNKCKYIIAPLSFASDATGVNSDLNKPKNILNLFQKFIDLYAANLIIKLDNFDLLYCVNDEVRLIKNINKNITNKDNVYYSVLTYFLINTNDLESSIKYTNKVMLSSSSELDMVKNIPDYNEIKSILDNINIVSNEIPKNETINNTDALDGESKDIDLNENLVNSNVVENQVLQNNSSTEEIEQPKLSNLENVVTTNIPSEGVNEIETL